MTQFAHRTINNSIFNLLGWGWSIVLSLVATRYIVQGLGREGYGILALALSTIGYFAVLDMGLNTAAIKFIAEYHAKQDLVGLNKVIWTTLVIFGFVGCIGSILAITLINTIGLEVFQVSNVLYADAEFVFYVVAVGLPLNLLIGALSSIPNALQRYDLSNELGIAITTLSTLITLGLLALGYGLKSIALFQLIVTIVSFIPHVLVAKWLIPELTWRPRFAWNILKKLFSFGIFTLSNRLGAMLLFHFDRLMIGILLGASFVTYYVVPFSLSVQLHRIVVKIATVLFPVSSALSSVGRIEELGQLYHKAVKVTLTISTFMCVTLVVFSYPILKIWIDQSFAETSWLTLTVLALGWYFISLSVVATVFLDGFGKPHLTGFATLCTSVINVLGVTLLVPRYGISGAAITTLLYLHTLALMYYVEKDLLRLNSWALVRDAYLKVWGAGFMVGCVSYYLLLPQVSNLLSLFAVVGLSGSLYMAIILAFKVFNNNERQIVLKYVSRLMITKRLGELS